jgi:hypothetical protein
MYTGFSESDLTQACNYVYQREEQVNSVSECLTAAQQDGYRTWYSLAQLRYACAELASIQKKIIAKSVSGINLFDAEVAEELFHGGPGVIYYRVAPGAFLPASCAKVIAPALVELHLPPLAPR